ncbi:radical SAM protein [Polymorphum gilvum]|uniref:Putative radical SAM superfamily protein n=1 Tax=Polymorphum gilvum (strain LMG 25793 / CGMCC 1.9160 / SL003B-26A1) TaxID=991905 RepID=F2IY39_POLGS|nr:radical SAM protein [Polymorphum gilvum]ADZ70542.1 Putative radical SAM superfamily protein [Polymorphum gilvum SL003B-26A1]
MALLQPRQLTVLTTSQCTAACDHCSMNSAPDRRERLDFATIRDTIDALHDAQPLGVVIFAGGEPTLLGETLLDAIAHADGLGITTRIVTNASWAITPTKARAKITELRQAGLAELNISADDYHLPWIPFANVAHAWREAKGRGFSSVVIANCYGPNSLVTPDWIMEQLGERLPMRFDADGTPLGIPPPAADGTAYLMSNSYLQMLGRAHGRIDPADVIFPADPTELNGGCPWAVRSAALSPRGRLVACCGMEAEDNAVLDFGAVRDAGAQALVEKADRSAIMNAIALLGPAWVQDFVRRRRPDIAFRPRYATVCEICEDIVSRREVVEALKANLGALEPAVVFARLGAGASVERIETEDAA